MKTDFDYNLIPRSLQQFFETHPSLALDFSGGADSAYLLYAAVTCGCKVRAYYVSTPFQPQFELEDAKRLARELKADMTILPFDVLELPEVRKNPADRCYYCKNAIFRNILDAAKADGFTEIIDGTNASDDAGDRPGMRALKEMKVLSPLRICGITKSQLRAYSKNAGLFTWNKPAYACLATRIPTNIPIEESALQKVERAEEQLTRLGFSDFRVRVFPDGRLGWNARLQITKPQLPLLLEKQEAVYEALKEDFSEVLLDLNLRTASL